MPEPSNRFPDNVPGRWYVDSNCIICGMCEELAPAVFRSTADYDHAFVHHQPATADELREAERVRESCPVEAIGDDG